MARSLAEAGARNVHGVDRKSARIAGVTMVAADLLDSAATGAVLERLRPRILVHCAWTTEHGRYWHDAEANRRWVAASLDLARAFAAAGGDRFVGIGSMAEYDWTAPQPMSEAATPLAPATAYGRAKLELWRNLEKLAANSELAVAWARPFLVYGPNEDRRRFVSYIASSVLAGDIASCGGGDRLRDYMDVRDVGRAIATLALSPVTGAVNIASGEPVTLGAVARTVGALAGDERLVALGARPDPDGDPAVLTADIRRLRDEVRFSSRISLEQGLADTVSALRARSLERPEDGG